jgi:hypothetical protein
MNKEELLKDLEAAKQKLASLEQQIKEVDQVSAEQFVINCIEGCVIHKDAMYPDSVFYMKDGKMWFEIAKDKMWVNFSKVWNILSEQHRLSYADIQSLIKDVVEKHFKWRELTPKTKHNSSHYLVEKHFKWQGVTPKI